MTFRIIFMPIAQQALERLAVENPAKHVKVLKTFALMEANLRHQGLQTHKFTSLTGPNGEEMFESYVENKTPSALRVFWHYGPGQGVITITTITPHP